MLQIFLLAAATGFASAELTCEDSLLAFLGAYPGLVGTPAQQTTFVATQCDRRDDFGSELDDLVAACGADNEPVVVAIMDLLKDQICEKDGDVYCMASFLALVDANYLVQIPLGVYIPKLAPVFADDDRSAALWASEKCYFKLAKAAFNITRELSITVTVDPILESIVSQIECGFPKNSNGVPCASLRSTLVNKADNDNWIPAGACSNGAGSFCARTMSRCFNIPFDENSVCVTTPDVANNSISFKVLLKNVPYTYYSDNADIVAAALKSDIVLNLFSVLETDVTLEFVNTTYLTVQVSITGPFLDQNTDLIVQLLNAAKTRTGEGLFLLNALENLVPSSVRFATGLSLSDIGQLEIDTIVVTDPSPAPTASNATGSNNQQTSGSNAVLAVGVAAFAPAVLLF